MSDSPAQEAQGLLSPFLTRQRYTHAARFVSDDDTVLDLGCGSGKLKHYLPKGATYQGADIARYWKRGAPNFFVVKVGDPLPGLIRTAGVSVVTALALIEHLSQPQELFADAGKALATGGRVVLTTPHPIGRSIHDFSGKIGLASSDASEEHETFLDKRDLRKLGERAGFELVAYKRFLFGMNQVAVFEKTKTT
ncbi:class I SAM-dependent methyltransferase [Patescibacteria group bacterium]|nr:class I SAM-dependent methyltransferase [Patescibacteria group bacterium]